MNCPNRILPTFHDRQKKWHTKTRDGCNTCRRRRVKCDEIKPRCARCVKGSLTCEWRAPLPTLSLVLPIASKVQLDERKFPMGQYDFHHYLHASAPLIVQWRQCPRFWSTVLPSMGETSSAIRCSLLAISAGNQFYSSKSVDTIKLLSNRGDSYYGQACAMLKPGSSVKLEEALIVSFTLWAYDWFFGRPSKSWVHTHAAVKLFYGLEHGNSSWPSALTDESRTRLLETARVWFHDLNFPIEHAEFLVMLEKRAQSEGGTDNEGTTAERPLPLMNPFAKLATPTRINSIFWLIIVANSKKELYVIQQALDHCTYQLAQESSPKSEDQQIFANQVRLYTLFCQIHIGEDKDQEQETMDKHMSEIMDLIRASSILAKNKDVVNTKPTDLGTLGYISQHAHDNDIRFRAMRQITTYGM